MASRFSFGDKEYKRTKIYNKPWRDHHTRVLIELWKEHFGAIRAQKRNRHIFSSIARELQEVLNLDDPYTDVDCQEKVSALRKYWRKLNSRMTSSAAQPNWQFYSMISEIEDAEHSSSLESSGIESHATESISNIVDLSDEEINDNMSPEKDVRMKMTADNNNEQSDLEKVQLLDKMQKDLEEEQNFLVTSVEYVKKLLENQNKILERFADNMLGSVEKMVNLRERILDEMTS